MGLPWEKIAIEDTDNGVWFIAKPLPQRRVVDMHFIDTPSPDHLRRHKKSLHKVGWDSPGRVVIRPPLAVFIAEMRSEPHTLMEYFHIEGYLRWHIPEAVTFLHPDGTPFSAGLI